MKYSNFKHPKIGLPPSLYEGNLTQARFIRAVGEAFRRSYIYEAGRGVYGLQDGRWQLLDAPAGVVQLDAFTDLQYPSFSANGTKKDVKRKTILLKRMAGWLDSIRFRAVVWRQGACYCENLRESPGLIGFKNGVLERDLIFRPYNKRDIVLRVLPYNYDSRVVPDCSFIYEVLPKDTANWLLKKLAFSLFPKNYAYIPFLLGTASNGKTSLLEVVQKVFGPLASSVPANLFSENISDYARAALLDTKVKDARYLVCDELKAKRLDQSFIKSLADSGEIVYNGKYSTQTKSFKNTALLLMVGNEEPSSVAGEALFRRLKIVEFPYTFKPTPVGDQKQMDPHRVDKVNPMAFLNAILTFYDVGMSEPEPPVSIMEKTEELKVANDPVQEAIRDIEPRSFISGGEPASDYIRRVQGYLVNNGYFTRNNMPSGTLIGRRAGKIWHKIRNKQGIAYYPFPPDKIPGPKVVKMVPQEGILPGTEA